MEKEMQENARMASCVRGSHMVDTHLLNLLAGKLDQGLSPSEKRMLTRRFSIPTRGQRMCFRPGTGEETGGRTSGFGINPTFSIYLVLEERVGRISAGRTATRFVRLHTKWRH